MLHRFWVTLFRHAIVAGKRSLTQRGMLFAAMTLWLHIKNRVRRVGVERNLTPLLPRRCIATHQLKHGADLGVIQELPSRANHNATKICAHGVPDLHSPCGLSRRRSSSYAPVPWVAGSDW